MAHGTAAEGAVLELDLRHVEARCLSCATTFSPDFHVLLCPICGSVGGELLGPTGVTIDTMDVEG
jgi:hydrogenase nickel incorporation protein HypA/HybF